MLSFLVLVIVLYCCINVTVAFQVSSLSSPLPSLRATSSLYRKFAGKNAAIRLYMSTAPAWSPSRLIDNKVDAEGLRSIKIEVNEEIANAFKVPGQYVQMKKGDGKASFFAVASPPDGRNIMSFLIKETENNAFLTSSIVDSLVDVSIPQGKGFQLEEYFEKYKYDYPVTNVLLMACGSGLAPIASVLDSDLLGLNKINYNSLYPRKATLYIGARTQHHLPMANKYAEWEEKGVTIIPVLSQGKHTYMRMS